MHVREAGPSDISTITTLINAAYVVERFFKAGDRTTTAEVAALGGQGTFLLLESKGAAIGTVYVELRGERGYIGLLSVDPLRQGGGAGRRLMHAAEDWCRAGHAIVSDLKVVSLREELPGFYRKLGYVEQGSEPFPEEEGATRPCHFILMSKLLTGG